MTTDKPTTIKPNQWADVASAVVFGSCEVRYGVNIIENVEYSANDYYILFYKQRDEFDFDPYDEVHGDDATLTVRWLPTTGTAPATAQPDSTEALLPQTVDTVRYGTPEYEQLSREDCEREVARLKAELASAQAENKRLRTTVEAAQEWAHMGDDVGFDEAVMVCDALMEAVFKYEQALNAVADGGSEGGEG